MPDELRYLYNWARELYGRSGVGMGGMNPLAYSTLESWGRLTGRRPSPLEVEALLALDSVLRDPDGKP